jgi:hypothetical protein
MSIANTLELFQTELSAEKGGKYILKEQRTGNLIAKLFHCP